MHKRKMWFDALRERVAEAEKSGEISLPGLDFFDITELNNDLENAELLLVSHDVVKQLVENGTAPEDLRAGFQMPFERSFIEVDPAVRLAEEHGGLRGMLVIRKKRRYRVRVWFDVKPMIGAPRYDFSFSPTGRQEEPYKRITDLLYWLSGYMSAANVLAVRHNRRYGLIKRHLQEGKLVPSSYYTFESITEPVNSQVRRRPIAHAPRTTIVQGHFRRAHWHMLPAIPKRVWYPTTWVRAHTRRIPEAEVEEAAKKAA